MKPFVGLATLMIFFTAQAHAAPNALDDAAAKACPGEQAWEAAQKAAGAHSSFGPGAEKRDAARHPTDPTLRAELLRRETEDQNVRTTVIHAGTKATAAQWSAVQNVDRDNHDWLKTYIAAHGVPGVSQVGEIGVHSVWTLVQHADADPAFQAHMLDLFKPMLASGQINPSDYALLEDRVLLKQGKPQLYGSQFQGDPSHPSTFKPQPVQDPAHLDERRAKMGLMPLADYECVMQVFYGGATGAKATPTVQKASQ